ncbi:Flp pilus assembly protein CpaB [Bremerella sp. P1]|uniref:Flp pilus assembly protein CpaB n=1 Tax=Bremerella sp. P1 TaxID=3026424 RepID=UPI002367A7D6|nr:Flp pilus assembly protein CpaB [Bremerella sp. P1]WDI40791.1 Flp pilus assembly protein CpaB [Bremerella sp. P1]
MGVVAVMFGLLGAYIVQKNMQQPQPVAIDNAPQTYIVPRASMDLTAGRELTMGDMVIQRLTAKQVQEEGLPLQFMGRTSDIIGRTLRVDVPKGSSFDAHLFYPEGTGPSIVERLDPGMRAMTIKVAADEAVDMFATPGTWVDVLFRSEEDSSEDLPEMTVSLLEGVKVLAVNSTTTEMRNIRGQREARQETSVTLSVTPDQAVALRVVENRGTMALALRHPDDVDANAQFAGMTMDELLNRPVARERIEVYRGHNISQVEFRERFRANFDPEKLAKQNLNKQAKADPPANADAVK